MKYFLEHVGELFEAVPVIYLPAYAQQILSAGKMNGRPLAFRICSRFVIILQTIMRMLCILGSIIVYYVQWDEQVCGGSSQTKKKLSDMNVAVSEFPETMDNHSILGLGLRPLKSWYLSHIWSDFRKLRYQQETFFVYGYRYKKLVLV